MSFKQKYTPKMVCGAIEKYDDFARVGEIAKTIGCSVRTAETLLNIMMVKKQVQRVNRGSRGANIWFYSRIEQS